MVGGQISYWNPVLVTPSPVSTETFASCWHEKAKPAGYSAFCADLKFEAQGCLQSQERDCRLCSDSHLMSSCTADVHNVPACFLIDPFHIIASLELSKACIYQHSRENDFGPRQPLKLFGNLGPLPLPHPCVSGTLEQESSPSLQTLLMALHISLETIVCGCLEVALILDVDGIFTDSNTGDWGILDLNYLPL